MLLEQVGECAAIPGPKPIEQVDGFTGWVVPDLAHTLGLARCRRFGTRKWDSPRIMISKSGENEPESSFDELNEATNRPSEIPIMDRVTIDRRIRASRGRLDGRGHGELRPRTSPRLTTNQGRRAGSQTALAADQMARGQKAIALAGGS